MVKHGPSDIERSGQAAAEEPERYPLPDPALGALGRGLAYFARVSEHEHRLALERERARR